MITFPRISATENNIFVEINGQKKRFQRSPLPSSFIEWQIAEREQMFQNLKNKEKPLFLSPHLPTLITIADKNIEFGVNAASKGIGLVPTDEEILLLTRKMQGATKSLQDKECDLSLQKRVDVTKMLYGSLDKIDRFCLGGLEIFETRSFTNMMNDPRVSLFFVGGSPSYKSYQINCIAEIIDPTKIFYQFISTIRSLFEQETFHYQQPKYPYAIKYHVIEVFDKSLKVRGE